MKKILPVIITFILFTQTVFASQTRKVLVIGVDGCRSDAMVQANTPNLDALVANGLFSYDAWHCGITVSGPSWSTIMTGVWWNKHGVTGNSYTGSNFNQYPYFTTRAKEIKPNLRCVEVIEWAPLITGVYNDNWDLQISTPDGISDSTGPVAAAELLADDSLDCLFVYFDAVDLAGHSTGFDPANAAYIQAIEKVDVNIGRIRNALHNRPNSANEDWLVLVVTDHGGTGTLHGGNSWAERHIWWVASGAAVPHQQISEADPGTYNPLLIGVFNASGVDTAKLRRSPVQTDCAVTALHHLIYDSGLRPENQTAWNLDGKSWLTTTVTGIEETPPTNLKVFPNPTIGMVTFWFENPQNNCVSYHVYDVSGKLVREAANIDAANKLNIDLSGSAKGNYFAELHIGTQILTKKIVME